MDETRTSNGLKNNGAMCQFTSACHAGGREFESRPDRKERK